MDISTVIKAIVEIGITPALLIFFVKYFFDRDKNRDAQMETQYSNFQEQYKNFRERENILIAESSRREELMRLEAEKREKILRQEADKRESHLMVTIDGFSKTMKEISSAMEGIKNSYLQMESKIGNIEAKIESIETKTEKAGCDDGYIRGAKAEGA